MILVDALAKTTVAGIVIDIFLDLGRAISRTDIEFYGKTSPHGIEISGRQTGSPEVTRVFAFEIDVVVVAELAVDSTEESLKRSILAEPVAWFDNVRCKSLEFVAMGIVVFTVSGREQHRILLLEVKLAMHIGCPRGVFKVRHHAYPFEQICPYIPPWVLYNISLLHIRTVVSGKDALVGSLFAQFTFRGSSIVGLHTCLNIHWSDNNASKTRGNYHSS